MKKPRAVISAMCGATFDVRATKKSMATLKMLLSNSLEMLLGSCGAKRPAYKDKKIVITALT